MKITPIEIRQKTFEKAFRGYEKEEVDAFLVSLSQEWERIVGDVQNLKSKLTQSEADVQKLREVESSLYRTLKAAEDTGANMVQQANRDADLQLREAQMQAESVLNDAKNQARDLIDDAELRAREISGELRDELKKLENDYRTLESYRDNLILEMKGLASGTLDKLNTQNFQKVDFGSIKKAVQSEFQSKASQEPLLGESVIPENQKEMVTSNEVLFEIEGPVQIVGEENSGMSSESKENNNKSEGSFFDSLG